MDHPVCAWVLIAGPYVAFVIFFVLHHLARRKNLRIEELHQRVIDVFERHNGTLERIHVALLDRKEVDVESVVPRKR